MDCDNNHSDNPEDWLTVQKLTERLPGVEFLIVYSKSHMKEKKEGRKADGKIYSARPRFHVYFALSRTFTIADEIRGLKEQLLQVIPEFDAGAKDAARFFFGVEKPRGEYHEDTLCVDEFISSQSISFMKAECEAEKEPADKIETKQVSMAVKPAVVKKAEVKSKPVSLGRHNIPWRLVEEKFLEAMRKNGIIPKGYLTLIPDGKIHRLDVEGDSKCRLKGAYILNYDCEWPGGGFWCWGHDEKWIPFTFPKEAIPREERLTYVKNRATNPPTPEEKEAYLAAKDAARVEREQAEAEARQKAYAMAWREYSGACFLRMKVTKHPYVVEKITPLQYAVMTSEAKEGVYDYSERNMWGDEPFGPQFTPTKNNAFMLSIVENTIAGGYCKRGDLLIPLVDVRTGQFMNLQIISSDKVNGIYSKRNYSGLHVKYACYPLLSPGWEKSNVICLAEGLFTGLAVLSITKNRYPVICTMGVGNLAPVAEVLRRRFSDRRIIDMADNDNGTKLKTGENKGIKVAEELRENHLVDEVLPAEIKGCDDRNIDYDDVLKYLIGGKNEG